MNAEPLPRDLSDWLSRPGPVIDRDAFLEAEAEELYHAVLTFLLFREIGGVL